MNNMINLENLTDRQKILLSQISYLDINLEGRNKIASGGIYVSELKEYLKNPETPFCGDAWLGEGGFNFVASGVVGKDNIPSRADVVDELITAGLGSLKITNVSNNQKFSSSGFQALTLKDSADNVAISYRGSDFDFSSGGIRDWVESDLLEYFKNDSTQRGEALEYFEANKNQNGKNYLYGHSLGGNLTSHVYLQHYDEVQEAFTINGNPINQKLINTPERVAAFNDSKKYNCNIICGDVVGHLKSYELYKDNVNYIKNNDSMKESFVSAHMVQSATFDHTGNFVQTTEEEMIQKMGSFKTKFLQVIKNIREAMNDMQNKIDKFNTAGKISFERYKDEVYTSLQNKIEKFRFNKSSTDEMSYSNNNELKNRFKNAAMLSEKIEIEQLQKQIAENRLMKSEIFDDSISQNEEKYSHTL